MSTKNSARVGLHMRNPIGTIFLLLMPLPAIAGEQKIANTLSQQAVRDGWILLFDGDTTFGWNIDGEAKVGDGILALGGARETKASLTAEFGDAFEFIYESRDLGAKTHRLNIKGALAGHSAGGGSALEENRRWTGQYIKAFYDRDRHFVNIYAWHRGKWAGPGSGSAQVSERRGTFQLSLNVAKGSRSEIRSFKLRPLGMKPLFNGNDLTGWKIFPGKRSQFTVSDGAIHIIDGPGDLQTEGKYRDFILQFECKSNGKHLNSGVFFRCRAGEYQNGYEAQIRNQFTAEPKQVYTIEEYDPKTHELLDKKKVKYTAVDYGTGAIYRRQPARRAVARDGEWFTMTVLAHGNRFATWVNGIQVTDWTDNRPPSDNARTGFCRAAGHISLQGHDPTTNLSFRDFRIAALSDK